MRELHSPAVGDTVTVEFRVDAVLSTGEINLRRGNLLVCRILPEDVRRVCAEMPLKYSLAEIDQMRDDLRTSKLPWEGCKTNPVFEEQVESRLRTCLGASIDPAELANAAQAQRNYWRQRDKAKKGQAE